MTDNNDDRILHQLERLSDALVSAAKDHAVTREQLVRLEGKINLQTEKIDALSKADNDHARDIDELQTEQAKDGRRWAALVGASAASGAAGGWFAGVLKSLIGG